MADLDITIKRKNGAGYDVLHPTTIIGQVTGLQTALDAKINTSARGAANGVASLDASSKIPIAQLPNSVFDGLYFYATISATSTSQQLADALLTARSYAITDIGRTAEGFYWVISTAGTISGHTAQNNTSTPGVYTTVIINHAEGSSTGTTTGALEVGDWIVITDIQGAGTLGAPYEFYISPINNTYENATTAIDGIVRLSSSTLTSTTGNNVITDGILNGLVTATTGTANKIAASAHNHDSAYLGISANAVSASKWANARTITLAGDLTGSVSIDGSANVTLTAEVSNDSHTHSFANITSKPTTLSGYGITDAVLANTAITGATKTKITYDAKGLVTAGADLVAADIPNLDTAKITTGTFAIARIPTGTTSSTVALGNHTHTFASLTSKPTTLSGYGITDAASTSDLTNRPEIYYNASANSDGDLVLDLDSDGAVA
jgi:hypothetical protein